MKDETSKSKIINDDLLKLQEEWFNVCDVYSMAKKYPLSEPFSFAVTEQYMRSKCTIMIVGQEPMNFDGFNENSKSHDVLRESQNFTKEYSKKQLGYHISDEYKFIFKKSPFWHLFREIAEIGLEPAWNNLDKFHQIINRKTACLSFEMESVLSKTYGKDNKSLLQREIELTKPSIVLFVTGPNYYMSMASALNITDGLLQGYKPTKSIPCRQITDITNMNVPILWSYHPGYLRRIKSISNVIDMIKNCVRK